MKDIRQRIAECPSAGIAGQACYELALENEQLRAERDAMIAENLGIKRTLREILAGKDKG
jgi:hypothetical protein